MKPYLVIYAPSKVNTIRVTDKFLRDNKIYKCCYGSSYVGLNDNEIPESGIVSSDVKVELMLHDIGVKLNGIIEISKGAKKFVKENETFDYNEVEIKDCCTFCGVYEIDMIGIIHMDWCKNKKEPLEPIAFIKCSKCDSLH